MRHDAGLVVGGTAAVEAVAALRRLERRRLPVLVVARAAARRGGRRAARWGARCGPRGARPPRAGPAPGHPLALCTADGRAAHLDEVEHAECRAPARRRRRRSLRRGRIERGPRDRGDAARGVRGRRWSTGNPASTALRNASMRASASSDADSVRRGSVMPVILRGTDSRNPVAKQPDSTDRPSAETLDETQARLKNGTRVHPRPAVQQQEAARKRPLVPDDRKEAAKQARAKAAESREKARVGMAMGDEKYLPMRDRGPQKKYVRDYVDARFSIGEVLIPVMFAVIVLTFIPSPEVQYHRHPRALGVLRDRRHRRRRPRLHPQQEARGQVRRGQGREGALVRRDARAAAATAAPAEAAGQARPVPLLIREPCDDRRLPRRSTIRMSRARRLTARVRSRANERNPGLVVAQRAVLADHRFGLPIRFATVVVGDARPRRHDHVADARTHLGGRPRRRVRARSPRRASAPTRARPRPPATDRRGRLARPRRAPARSTARGTAARRRRGAPRR